MFADQATDAAVSRRRVQSSPGTEDAQVQQVVTSRVSFSRTLHVSPEWQDCTHAILQWESAETSWSIVDEQLLRKAESKIFPFSYNLSLSLPFLFTSHTLPSFYATTPFSPFRQGCKLLGLIVRLCVRIMTEEKTILNVLHPQIREETVFVASVYDIKEWPRYYS